MQLNDVYKVDGLLKQKFSDYQIREGQVEMSKLIQMAVNDRKSAIIEGATGVGKGFAYLIPLLINSQKAIVSTSNKALQDQLDKKDLPTLKDVLGIDFKWSVLKGKNNYFCLEHYKNNEEEILSKLKWLKMADSEAIVFYQQLGQWADMSETGDLEYCELELPSAIRELVACDNYTQHEVDSDYSKKCFANIARARAKSSDILLVNHTLLALDASLRLKSNGDVGILPKRDNIVVDEAHEFERCAVLAFSDEIGMMSLLHFLNWGLVKRVTTPADHESAKKSLQKVLGMYLPDKGVGGYYAQNKVKKFEGVDEVIQVIEHLIYKLNTSYSQADDKTTAKVKQIIKEGENLMERLSMLGEEDENTIKWSEAKDNKLGDPMVKLKVVPLDISPLIKAGLFDDHVVICCSATLSVHGKFDFFRYQTGFPEDSFELVVPSPFDYKQQALNYISDGSFDPIYEMQELIEMSKGNAFVLFTSYKDMNDYYNRINIPYPKLIQNKDQTRAATLEEFKNTPNSVLFATKSFWEGVDIRGDKLSLVIIHKIPFENPRDLIFSSKMEKMDQKYGRGASFIKLYVPDACIKLKQGVGRLIRSVNDKGVIALLDARVNFKPYGGIIIDTLPPAYRTQQLEKVKKFFIKIGIN